MAQRENSRFYFHFRWCWVHRFCFCVCVQCALDFKTCKKNSAPPTKNEVQVLVAYAARPLGFLTCLHPLLRQAYRQEKTKVRLCPLCPSKVSTVCQTNECVPRNQSSAEYHHNNYSPHYTPRPPHPSQRNLSSDLNVCLVVLVDDGVVRAVLASVRPRCRRLRRCGRGRR